MNKIILFLTMLSMHVVNTADEKKIALLNEGLLHYAEYGGPIWILQSLLKDGAHVGACRPSGATPLHYAAEQGHKETIRELVEQHADINTPNRRGETPLWRAARFGQFEAAILLLKLGADAESKNEAGEAPADIAQEWGYNDIAHYISNWKKPALMKD